MRRKIRTTLLLECLQGSGGEERFISTFLRNFVSDWVDVELTVLHEGTSFYPLPTSISIFVLDLLSLTDSTKLNVEIPLSLLDERESFVWLEFASTKLAKYLHIKKIDCVIATNFLTSILAYKASLQSKTKAIGMLAGNFSATLLWDSTRRDFRVFEVSRLKALNPIICISQGIANDLVMNWGFPAKHLRVIHYPLDISMVRSMSQEHVHHIWLSEQTPVFIFVGRLAKQKGLEFLLKALKKVNSSTQARLIIIGDGEERTLLQELVKILDLEDKVAFIGSDPNPFKYMRKATALVLPSLFEGLSYVIMEALACGCPVIATDCPSGPAEILQNGKYGLLVPPGDETALAQAMLKLLENPPLRHELSQLGLQRASDFNAPRIMRQYEDLILKTLGVRAWHLRALRGLRGFFSSSRH